LSFSKAARNNTQNIADANNTTAAAGDSITYTLSVKNNGTKTASAFTIEENLGDVLEYAQNDMPTDLNGGTIGDDHIIHWPAVSKTVTIQVKTTIPQTPQSTSNPGSHDLMMTNVYGNAINIKLPGSVAKVVEQTTTTLPNTGPGTTVFMASLITIAAGYFFARTRLMAKELDLVREEYTTAGGF